MAATRRLALSQCWEEAACLSFYGMQSLHEIFEVVGSHLTDTDLEVLSFLLDETYPATAGVHKPKDGVELLLELERRGVCDESNFNHLLQLLRILTRHDLMPFVTQKKRRSPLSSPPSLSCLCSPSSVSPSSCLSLSLSSPFSAPLSSMSPLSSPPSLSCLSSPFPSLSSPPSLACLCSPSSMSLLTPSLSSPPRSPVSLSPDVRLRVRAEYCDHEAALRGGVSSSKPGLAERQFDLFSQADALLRSRDLGAIVCDIKFSDLSYLDAFWKDYLSGALLEALKGVFITDSLRRAVGREAVELLVSVDEEDYAEGRRRLLGDRGQPLR
ncbi:DNA-binding death effector domain-containing protein 2-like [Acipenser oxyrinchus oxyrinchus]|uniref:DNA-binding death effector domain-containing protein 2-like n=1 Tax=Acipenser oxyrinchus oxyrinchus TaxID=40147 RepID=A0AAD8CII3_ACIOX|nr:DNA-binding death effector domain-containing protein 2-like [Acipenser oxyrinchus oxyrinchus]